MPAPRGSSTACHKGRAWTVEPPELERVVGQSGDGLHWVGTSEWHAETRRVVRTGAGSGCRTGWARRRLGVGMSAWHAPAVARPVVQERHVGMASRLGSERFGLGCRKGGPVRCWHVGLARSRRAAGVSGRTGWVSAGMSVWLDSW